MSPAISIAMPSVLTDALTESLDGAAVGRWVLEALLLAGVRDNLLSTGDAAESLGLEYFETLALIKKRGIHLELSNEEFEQDQIDIQAISALLDQK